MRRALVVILIPALLFASTAPTYAWSAPAAPEPAPVVEKTTAEKGTAEKVVVENVAVEKPGVEESTRNPTEGTPANSEPGEEAPTSVALPPVGLTPRVDSFEVVERCLRASLDRESASLRFAFCDVWRVPVHHHPARQDVLNLRSRRFPGAVRAVAPCIWSKAPPLL